MLLWLKRVNQFLHINNMTLNKTFAYVNGKILPAEKASLSIFDRGLVLGDGLFETLRTVNGHPQFLPLHYERLRKSARTLLIKMPIALDELEKVIKTLCRKSKLEDVSTRITVTRGKYHGGLGIDPSIPPSLIITVAPVKGLGEEIYSKGVPVAISSINKAAASGLDSKIKSTNYLANIFAKAEADKKHCYESILLGPKGEIAELSTASFFGVINGIVITPPLDTGILPGITRQLLLQILKKQKIPFREGQIFPKDVAHMSEAFLSSSVRGIVPITRIEKAKVGSGKVGPVFIRLRQLYVETCIQDAKQSIKL